MKVVRVRWIDSVRTGGWRALDPSEEKRPDAAMLCESVGFLVADTKDFITIALSKSRNDKHVCDTMLIPKVAVESIKVLRKG